MHAHKSVTYLKLTHGLLVKNNDKCKQQSCIELNIQGIVTMITKIELIYTKKPIVVLTKQLVPL